MAKTLEAILGKFGFATVLEPTFYEVGAAIEEANELFTIDSLRISNITQEGPTKEAKGGLHAKTQMRYGKTMRLEMEDVVGRIEVLGRLMGAKLIEEDAVPGPGKVVTGIQITEKFAKPVQIVGRTFVIDQTDGEKEWVTIHIKKFLPDSVFEQTMEAEGDFGAMNIAGQIFPDDCGVFYTLEAGTNPCPPDEE